MNTLAMVVALLVATVGALGMLAPSSLVWIGQQSLTSTAFYCIAAVRVAFGLLLISVAQSSRWPKGIQVLGYVIVIAGFVTALTGLLAMERARAIIEWWLQQGSGAVRLAGALVAALGSLLAYACAPRHPERPGRSLTE